MGAYVISGTDGEKHYINARQLTKLYGLNPKECILTKESSPDSLHGLPANLPKLGPRYLGDYKKSLEQAIKTYER